MHKRVVCGAGLLQQGLLEAPPAALPGVHGLAHHGGREVGEGACTDHPSLLMTSLAAYTAEEWVVKQG